MGKDRGVKNVQGRMVEEVSGTANGIPSHDTIRRLFIRLDPEALQRCFLRWMEAIQGSIYGKTVRRSGDAASGNTAVHLISAWALDRGVSLGQRKTEDQSNEIPFSPVFLDMLEIRGTIVSVDVEGCQTEIAARIRDKQAD